MLAPVVRSSVNASASAARLALAQRTASVQAIAARRTMVTQHERWDQQTIKQATQSNLIPDASGKATMDLASVVPNLEARWADMSKEEQYGVYRHLEELQRKDWKELSLDQKKAAYYISFGPHGPRKAITAPGQGMRTAIGVVTIIGATVALFVGIRSFAHPAPKTMTKDYQEQMTEKAKEEKLNPITGVSSEGYKGTGYVQKSYTS